MKPIVGTVVSSKPVSLSRAAAALSKFVSSETCAIPEISAYLARASEAFDELVEYHRSLRGRGGRGEVESGDLGAGGARGEAPAGKGVVLPDGEAERRDLGGSEGERKRKEKEKAGSFQEAEGGETRASGNDGKKRREDRDDGEVVENGVCGHRSDKKKEKNRGGACGDSNGGKLMENGEYGKKRKKKRDNGDMLDGSGERNDGVEVGDGENGEVGDHGWKHGKKMGKEIKEKESGGGRENGEQILKKNKKKKRDKEGEEVEANDRGKKKRKHNEEDVEDGATRVEERHKKREVEQSEQFPRMKRKHDEEDVDGGATRVELHEKRDVEESKQLPKRKKRKHDERNVEGGAIIVEERHEKRKVEGRIKPWHHEERPKGKGKVGQIMFEESDEDIDLVEGLEDDAGINYMDDSLDDAISSSEENFDIDYE